ncbi:unnamed protein product [Parnassius mnemosyne]|uniref:DDE Tnp4 domain-containing protein n=1 Tax=Parnassius mnemosyne TaxID=213953 RepID=A0AAV1LQX3_9NEOP
MDRDYFVDDMRVIDEINEVVKQIPLMRRVKFYKIRKNPLEELQEAEFKIKYRFSRGTTVFPIDMMKNDLAGDSRGGFIPPHPNVLTAIRTWARGEIQDDAGDLSGMSQPTISLVCKQVALALVAQRAKWIKMPQSDVERNHVIAGFYSVCGFRLLIAYIFESRKQIHYNLLNLLFHINKAMSTLFQVVSNANLEIVDIVAHWRGTTHDSRIFDESRIKQRFEQSEFKGRLLGDFGYVCTPYLFTPNTQKKEMYNRSHIKIRNTVERCFGVWKQRFRCLQLELNTKLVNTKVYIVALAILHNIAMYKQDAVEDNGNVPVTELVNNSLRGNSVRAAFINENF